MQNGYERASNEVVPAARLAIAKALKEKYNMKENSIAQILGVAQAAVSKYVNNKCSPSVAELCGKIDQSNIDKYIDEIAKGNKQKLKSCICTICMDMNKFNCKFSALNKSAN